MMILKLKKIMKKIPQKIRIILKNFHPKILNWKTKIRKKPELELIEKVLKKKKELKSWKN